MHVKDHVPLAELKRLARSERDAKLSKRFQMVVSVKMRTFFLGLALVW
jgi:hypothetical protein